MDHTDQFQILTSFKERSGECRTWSCSVADPSRGQQCLCPQDMTQAPRPTQTTSTLKGSIPLWEEQNKNTRKQKVTRHICPKLKVIKAMKWASEAPLQGQKRKKKDQLICLSQWHQSRYGRHIFVFNICFGFGEDATNDHYDVTATSEKDDYGKGRSLFKSHLKALRLRQTTPTYTASSQ